MTCPRSHSNTQSLGSGSQPTAVIVSVDLEVMGSVHQVAVDVRTKCSEPQLLQMPWHSHWGC